ncbi:MAG: hypothetical protein WC700_13585 [Gemmatimonadaceae bacterium]|jgi:hypothetical protein
MRPALAIALLFLASAASAQTPRTYSYEFRLDQGDKKGQEVIHGTVRVSGSLARVDTDEKKAEGDHSYFLLADGGRTVYVVHPERRSYEEHDADEFARIVGTAMRAAGPVLKISVRDVRLDSARLGPGDRVAGRATQRVQLRQRWTTSMRVLGFVKEDMGGSSVAEYWSDPSLPLMRNPLFDIISTSQLVLAAADDDFLARADGARAALFRGSPLRADIRTTMSGEKGDDSARLRYEVTSITPGGVNEADLQLPKGYRQSTEKNVRMM